MRIKESKIREVIDLHNTILENISGEEFPFRKIAEKRVKSSSPSFSEIISGRIKKLSLAYFSLVLIFTFLSLTIIRSIENTTGKVLTNDIRMGVFRSDYKGGIVYGFNKVIK